MSIYPAEAPAHEQMLDGGEIEHMTRGGSLRAFQQQDPFCLLSYRRLILATEASKDRWIVAMFLTFIIIGWLKDFVAFVL